MRRSDASWVVWMYRTRGLVVTIARPVSSA